MTEPKRWTAGDIVALYMSDDQHWRDEFYAAADFDRLRDERDRLDSRITELQQNEAHAHRLAFEARTARAEAERVAGVLADALDAKLRDGRDDHGESGECPCEQCEQALAVFDTARAIAEEATRFECGDTLTEEKTDE